MESSLSSLSIKLVSTASKILAKAYRMWEQQIDFDDFAKIFEAVETSFIDKEDKDDSAQ